MTTFVLLTEDDQAVYLVRLLNALNDPNEFEQQKRAYNELKRAQVETPRQSQEQAATQQRLVATLEANETNRILNSPFGQYVKSENYAGLIEYGFFQSIKNVMVAPVEKIDTAFTLVFSLLPRLKQPANVQAVINKLSSRLSSNPQNHPALKLRLLAILFNLLGPRSYIRHSILMNIFDLALFSKRPKLPLTFVKPMDDWIKVWSQNTGVFPPEKAANTYRKVAQLAEAANDIKKKHDYMYKYVKALEGVKMVEPHLTHVARTVFEALKVAGGPKSKTIVTDCGRLVDMSAVRALQHVPNYAKLFKLLQIFASKPVADYIKFHEEDTAFISNAGLNYADCLSRIRTLTLCDLGMKHETLTFKDLEEKLVITGGDDAIEEAVLNAVMSGKLDAKIDQREKKIVILRATWRSFNHDDWRFLANKLDKWKTSLDSVIAETFDKR